MLHERSRNKRFLRVAFAFGWSFGAISSGIAQPASLLDFFAGQGCAIGPTTRSAALAAGFEPKPIDALTETARRDAETVKTGDWLVFSPSICKIRPPDVVRALKLTDPEVGKSISAPDAYAAEGDPGCFLQPGILFKEVQRTRQWDAETINLEYLRLLGASVVSGDLAFYSNSPVRTPVGFQLTTGRCADAPQMPEIRRNHEFLVKFFDPLIRANAAHVECRSGASPMSMELHDIAHGLSSGKTTNAWLGMEIQVIAMGAGWYEGMSMTRKGTPRPPLCHYK